MRNAERTREHTPELSFRPVLHEFLSALAKLIDEDVQITYEPRRQRLAGQPDWRFNSIRTLGLYGYAEAKPLDMRTGLTLQPYSEQISRYLGLGHKLILTDGIDFAFCDRHSEPVTISLISKPLSLSDNWTEHALSPTLEGKFRGFLKQERAREISEEHLIEQLARRARILAESIAELSDLSPTMSLDETEKKTITALNSLRRELELHHDSSLKISRMFADFVAQVLVFGLLYAHRILEAETENPKDLYEKLQVFWENSSYRAYTNHLRPIRALVQILGKELETPLGVLGTWYDDCRLFLASVRLTPDGRREPNYHSLYERFLIIFDPKTRYDYGAFYTPPSLARFAVRLASVVAVEEFQSTLFMEGNKLVDPCCGTGNFLEQLILAGGTDSGKPALVGFEILPAPYALTHHRLSFLRDRTSDLGNVSVVLTDTLSDDLEREKTGDSMSLIQAEQQLARGLARPPLIAVIGNPPSSDSFKRVDKRNRKIITRLVNDFRPPTTERRGGRENVQKQMQNEFVKFLRWSCEKLLQSPHGLLAIVVPSSFGDDISYKYARKWLFDHFDKFWVLDIDTDSRTGVSASSLFSTLQGRMLVLGIRGSKARMSPSGKVSYHSITNLAKEEKIRELAMERSPKEYLSLFEQLPLNEDSFSLRRQASFDRKLYERYWPLFSSSIKPSDDEPCVFLRHVRGVKLAPSGLFIHIERQFLLRRSHELLSERFDYLQFKSRWFQGQDKPPSIGKLSLDVRNAIGREIKSSEPPIRKYAYRPFLTVEALISEPVLETLARQPNSGTRIRPELISAFESPQTFGISMAPAPRQLGERIHRFASFCWYLPDDDLCKRGSARILCNNFPDYGSGSKLKWNRTPRPNVSRLLLSRLVEIVDGKSEELVNEVVFYVYAILCSDAYIKTFEGALFAGADVNVRIPITRDSELFHRIAEAGKKLATLEKYDHEVKVPIDFQGLLPLFDHEFRLTQWILDDTKEQIDLLQDNQVVISLAPVPREILLFTVSGYDVLQQWLKFHCYAYTRGPFTLQQYQTLLQLISKISSQLAILRYLEDDVRSLVAGEPDLLDPYGGKVSNLFSGHETSLR